LIGFGVFPNLFDTAEVLPVKVLQYDWQTFLAVGIFVIGLADFL
jgi:hypothetical protein